MALFSPCGMKRSNFPLSADISSAAIQVYPEIALETVVLNIDVDTCYDSIFYGMVISPAGKEVEMSRVYGPRSTPQNTPGKQRLYERWIRLGYISSSKTRLKNRTSFRKFRGI
jgi:hypothetical protein